MLETCSAKHRKGFIRTWCSTTMSICGWRRSNILDVQQPHSSHNFCFSLLQMVRDRFQLVSANCAGIWSRMSTNSSCSAFCSACAVRPAIDYDIWFAIILKMLLQSNLCATAYALCSSRKELMALLVCRRDAEYWTLYFNVEGSDSIVRAIQCFDIRLRVVAGNVETTTVKCCLREDDVAKDSWEQSLCCHTPKQLLRVTKVPVEC